jgi:hypothetical protein
MTELQISKKVKIELQIYKKMKIEPSDLQRNLEQNMYLGCPDIV